MKDFFNYRYRLNRQPYFFAGAALGLVGLATTRLPEAYNVQLPPMLKILFALLTIAAAVLGTLLTIRRLHDLDKSGWFALLQLVPIVNLIFALYLLFASGTQGPNRFGDDPLQTGVTAG